MPTMARVCAPETSLQHTLYIHTTPYKPAAWLAALSSSNLLSSFPNLVHDLTYGSPIGNPPPLSKSFLLPNLSSANIHPSLIYQELLMEVAAGRMSGPFTITQATIIFDGPFQSSPVGLVEKIPGNGSWHMIHYLSKHNVDGKSTNSWVGQVSYYLFCHLMGVPFVSFLVSLSCFWISMVVPCPMGLCAPAV